ncbi:DNA polymerase III subunit psi [Cronobacter muytjensii]|uniref:DNA polymerase III subunit psi n=1 Tax=Cronobacter muytjensii TaxID=413501 RepID=A0A2T7ARH6_9ENTR|nr:MULTISPECIES: DNA polymerase III subunit psi [Cronobacter]EKS1844955.1 DNA polymerase III subunit psi [Cronobacter muytjensii]ELY2497146.1 DNA polymerase III subunit psi [Cronobacter muytjensii]ELY3983682.1 DNA polymerase III subunit psi [Cronobacter muytjensii]ELY4520125.1 DNA polymerase III subunit psi [Cronobacter muytjensii]ELY4663240.1 DNA polymerase III subunit psi [Cronobacter muytjensii]
MTSRRDWRLQQLGITQWVLRRPAALLGEIAIVLPSHIRLVMVAAEPPPLSLPFIQDVLRALALDADQVMQLTPDRVAMLHDAHCNSWCLGVDAAPELPGARLVTPGLETLQRSGAARADLWQQICEHEDDFLTPAR